MSNGQTTTHSNHNPNTAPATTTKPKRERKPPKTLTKLEAALKINKVLSQFPAEERSAIVTLAQG